MHLANSLVWNWFRFELTQKYGKSNISVDQLLSMFEIVALVLDKRLVSVWLILAISTVSERPRMPF